MGTKRQNRSGRWTGITRWALRAACAGLIVSAGIAFAADDCLTVNLKEPLVLPDGTIHDASRLTLCTSRDLSPVTRLHELSLDGKPIGLVRSRVGVSEGPVRATPMVLFRRGSAGTLDLVGYAVPAGRRNQTFLIQPPLRARAATPANIVRTIPALPAESPQAVASAAAVLATN